MTARRVPAKAASVVDRVRSIDDLELVAIGSASLMCVLLLEGIGGAGADLLFGTVLSWLAVSVGIVSFWVAVVAVPIVARRGTASLPDWVRDRAAIVLAALIVGPLTIISAVGVDVNNADGPVLLSAIDHVWGDGTPFWLLESQDAPAPHLFYGVPLRMGLSADRLVVLPVIATALLSLWVAREVYARTNAADVAALSALTVISLPPIFGQGGRLPLYPVFTLAGLVGLAALVRWITSAAAWPVLVVGALGVAVAVASHGAGLYFAPMAFMTVVFITNRERLRKWLMAMVAVGLANLPWLVAHLWISGLTRVLTPRDTWFLTNGHLLNVNERFWNLAVGSRLETLVNLPVLFYDATGLLFPGILVLGLLGLRTIEGRARWYVAAGWIVLWTPLALSRSAGFVRYYYPVLPAVVVLCALGADVALRRFFPGRWRGAVVLAALGIVSLQLRDVVQTSVDGRLRGDPFVAEMRTAADAIDDDRGVIGYRSFFLNLADPTQDTYAHDVLDEAEYVALYEWDQEGLAQLATDRNIGWVLLLRPTARWEQRYNDAWLEPGFGTQAGHVEALRGADCLVAEGLEFELYELDRCLLNSEDGGP